MSNTFALQLEEMEEMIVPGDSAWFWGVAAGVAFGGGLIAGGILFT